MAIISESAKKLPAFTVKIKNSNNIVEGKKMKDGRLEYQIPGCNFVEVAW
jgi:hypothetical protein